MPTNLRHDGFEFMIRTHDHLPPHVHVKRAGLEVVINLGLGGKLPYVRDNNGMSNRERNAALLIAAANNRIFLEQWEKIHGKVDGE